MGELKVRNLSFEAGGRRILHPCSFSVTEGRFIALLGPSGSGKSTLLKAINGLIRPATGTVCFDGRDIWEDPQGFRRSVGYVPQDDIIHTGLTVERALYYSARLRLKPPVAEPDVAASDVAASDVTTSDVAASDIAAPKITKPDIAASKVTTAKAATEEDAERFYIDRVRTVMEQLELTGRGGVKIKNLSGGQRKRVSVGVELLTAPPMISLDEPTSGLDPALEAKMMALFRFLADGGRTLLVTTHSMDSLEMTDALLIMAEGRVVFAGPLAGALAFFGVPSPRDIFMKLAKVPAAEWERLYHQGHFAAKEY